MKIVSHNQQPILTLLFQLRVWPEQPFGIRLNLWITLSAELDQLLGMWPEKDLDTARALYVLENVPPCACHSQRSCCCLQLGCVLDVILR